MDEPLLGVVHGFLRAHVRCWRDPRLENHLMGIEYATHTHDVIIIGAGGSGRERGEPWSNFAELGGETLRTQLASSISAFRGAKLLLSI